MPTIHHGDCIETMNAMPPESVDAIVTDPPYGLGFMGRKWDALPPSQEWAEACYRVLKPGGHIAAFGGTRTWHRLAVAIEDAGFEMRDSLAWLYGSGFPKSHDVGKAIDKLAGAEREILATVKRGAGAIGSKSRVAQGYRPTVRDTTTSYVTAPATPEAEQWEGWGTALKPAFEPIVLARKPLTEKTVARNVLAHGTGAINIDGCRIATDEQIAAHHGTANPRVAMGDGWGEGYQVGQAASTPPNTSGRWPANVLLDHHAAAWVDEQSGFSVSKRAERGASSGILRLDGCHTVDELRALAEAGEKTPTGRDARKTLARYVASEDWPRGHTDSGGASRFFYTAKAPKRERPNVGGVQHPTVKPLAIMRWLIRLTTPPGGVVLDPFAGSGTTIEAALIEGFNPVGIEMEAEYLPLIQHRIDRQAGTLTD